MGIQIWPPTSRNATRAQRVHSRGGFTIIEIIVVVTVIAVLAALATFGFGSYQQSTRDAQRASSINVIAEALEKYYEQHGEYPGCSDVTAAIESVTDVLPDVERTAFIAPNAPDSEENSIECSTLTINGEDFYEYEGDGSSTCSSGSSCLSYTLKYKDEGTGQIASVESRRSASIVTSGAATLSNSSPTYTTVPLSWTPIDNVVSYTLERASTCSFSGAVEDTVAGTSTTVTGLSQNTPYCFRVAGNAGSGQRTSYSNNVTITTQSLLAPSPTIGSITNNSLTVSWAAISGAQSYDLEQTTGGFTGTPTVPGIAGTSSNRTGLSTGVAYHFKVRARATDNGSPVYSNWSSTVTGTPLLPSPTGVSVAWTNDYGSSSHSASCSMGSPQFSRATTYRTDGSKADNWGSWSSWTTNSSFADDFIAQGMYGKVKVKAQCISGSAESLEVESSTIENVRAITSISAGTWYNRTTAPALVGVGGGCVSGTNEMYKWGQIYHGSAGYHSGGGWGQWGDFQITNGPPNWSMNDGLNAFRISRTICRTPYYERSLISAVRGNTLQGSGLTNYNNFVNAGYNYGFDR